MKKIPFWLRETDSGEEGPEGGIDDNLDHFAGEPCPKVLPNSGVSQFFAHDDTVGFLKSKAQAPTKINESFMLNDADSLSWIIKARNGDRTVSKAKQTNPHIAAENAKIIREHIRVQKIADRGVLYILTNA